MPKKIDFEELFDSPASDLSPTSNDPIVPNQHPKIHNVPYRLAIVGEAPGVDEVLQGKPFVGYSGKTLDSFLSRFGILRDACFVGNVCQHRPPGNKIAAFDWDGPEIQNGIKQLTNDLSNFNPNVVLCLGGSALHALRNPFSVPRKRKSKDGAVFSFPDSVSDWRGSWFVSPSTSPAPLTKCIAAYHPAFTLRQYEYTPMLMLDIKRAFDDATTKELILPQRDLKVDLSFDGIVAELDKLIEAKPTVGTDIEGYWNNWNCISFATSPYSGFIVPFTGTNGRSLWTEDEEYLLMLKVRSVLSDPRITKVWQNGLYDRFCTQYGYNIPVRGPSHDIMLKHWETYCELEKSLAVQASIYTREPFYKTDRKSDDNRTFWLYCCKDSAVTLEIDQKIDKFLVGESRRHYDFNLTLLNSLLYMELRGLRYNKDLAKERRIETKKHIYEIQYEMDQISGLGPGTINKKQLEHLVRYSCCYVKDPSRPKKGFEEDVDTNLRCLLGPAPLSKMELGRISELLTKARSKATEKRKEFIPAGLNAKSKDLKAYLYGDLQLEVQVSPITGAVTTDYSALLKLSKKSNDPIIPLIITQNELKTRSQMLAIKTDSDGRVRAGYNVVGSETGRVTCYTSPTGSGYNMTTIPDENELKPVGHPLRTGMRDLITSDPGCLLGKCDLKGADGWTIGANLAALGERTMLDDLLFGLKPASILCYAMRHGGTLAAIAGKSRAELVELCKEVKKSDWDYFAYKQCIWGFCYLMGARKATNHVFNVSEGMVQMKESDMDAAKEIVMRRYNVPLWWRATENRLFRQPYPPKLESPSGHCRKFFGRKQEIVGQALAHEPQSVTTYATNQAIYNLWTDPENRITVNGVCRLRVEPMHQVHDEMVVQFKVEDLEWSLAKIKQWFNNPMKIAGIELTIPYDGSYGTNWAMDSTSRKGSI